jgi:hypothetical protein
VRTDLVIRIPVHDIGSEPEPLDLALRLAALGDTSPLLGMIGDSAKVSTEPIMSEFTEVLPAALVAHAGGEEAWLKLSDEEKFALPVAFYGPRWEEASAFVFRECRHLSREERLREVLRRLQAPPPEPAPAVVRSVSIDAGKLQS